MTLWGLEERVACAHVGNTLITSSKIWLMSSAPHLCGPSDLDMSVAQGQGGYGCHPLFQHHGLPDLLVDWCRDWAATGAQPRGIVRSGRPPPVGLCGSRVLVSSRSWWMVWRSPSGSPGP